MRKLLFVLIVMAIGPSPLLAKKPDWVSKRIYKTLSAGGLTPEGYASVLVFNLKSIKCKAGPKAKACMAYNHNYSPSREVKFKGAGLISLIKEVAPRAISEIKAEGELAYFIYELRCQKSSISGEYACSTQIDL